MPRYVVKTPVKIGKNLTLPAGEVADIPEDFDDAELRELIACGALEIVHGAEPEEGTEEDAKDKADNDADGKPDTKSTDGDKTGDGKGTKPKTSGTKKPA